MFYKLICIILYLCFALNHSSLAEKWSINIEGYLSGFKVGKSKVLFEIDNSKYLINIESTTTGLTKLFYPWKQIIKASGFIDFFLVKPLVYEIQDLRQDKKPGFININYQNSYPIINSAYPDPKKDTRRKQVAKNLLKNTFDPVNSIIALGLLSANYNSCNHSIKIFDGRRRFNIQFIQLQKNNNELKCKMEIIRVAGYSSKELAKHPKEGIIILKKLSKVNNLYFPTEVRIPLTIGSFYAKLSANLLLQ